MPNNQVEGGSDFFSQWRMQQQSFPPISESKMARAKRSAQEQAEASAQQAGEQQSTVGQGVALPGAPSGDPLGAIEAVTGGGGNVAMLGAMNPNDPLVYLGTMPRGKNQVLSGDALVQRNTSRRDRRTGTRKGKERLLPLSRAALDIYNWSGAQRRQWGEYLADIGMIDEDEKDNFDVLVKEWQVNVEASANFWQVGQRVTPWDAARIRATRYGLDGDDGQAGDDLFTGRKRSTQRQVNLSNPQEARQLIYEVLRDQIGRGPTEDEYAAFLKVIREAEEANPATVTTDVDYENGEVVNTSAVVNEGIGEEGLQYLIEEQARTLPEWGAYQAATRLYNALINDVVNAPY